MRRISPKNKKLPIIVVLSVVVALLLTTGLAYANSWWPFDASSQSNESSDTVNSTQEKNASDPTYSSEKNDSPTDNTESSNSSSQKESKTSVQVGITSATKQSDDIEIRAFVAGAIEGDGTCTATVTNGSKSVTGSSEAFIDVSTTQCEPIEIPQSRLGAGVWRITVQYQSSTHEGTSASMEITL